MNKLKENLTPKPSPLFLPTPRPQLHALCLHLRGDVNKSFAREISEVCLVICQLLEKLDALQQSFPVLERKEKPKTEDMYQKLS